MEVQEEVSNFERLVHTVTVTVTLVLVTGLVC